MKYIAWLLSFTVGFLSMAQEILWIRVSGFALETLPQGFAFVLAMFLMGISLGALIGKSVCTRYKNLILIAGWVLLVAGLLDLSLIFCIPFLFTSFYAAGLGLLIFISASIKGIIFPIAHHIGSTIDVKLGRSVSVVYFMNIMGSTLGPLVVGLFLLNTLTITASFQLLAISVLSFSALLLLFIFASQRNIYTLAGVLIVSLFTYQAVLSFDSKDHQLVAGLVKVDKIFLKSVIENRHGIIHTLKGEKEGDDIVYGGNVYDGRTNIDLRVNSNKVDRAYLLHILHKKPGRVLVIGLSTGAWTRILLTNPDIKKLDIVEINPGYIELIKSYPQLSPILEDSRVTLHIDDGRRWLRRHPQLKYDLIVMNTTFHWRANVTNLLSKEMLTLTGSHLNAGGVFTFNTTDSMDAFFTASQIFPYAYKYRNFIYVSDHDFRNAVNQEKFQLFKLKLADKAVFDATNKQDNDAISAMLNIPFKNIDEVKATSHRTLEVITDQNMIPEYKYGKRLFGSRQNL